MDEMEMWLSVGFGSALGERILGPAGTELEKEWGYGRDCVAGDRMDLTSKMGWG